jgi:dTDP-4-amino-4,6-dideoxygalactose transaminase
MFQVLLPPERDRGTFIACMKDRGIGVGVHYPALHLFTLYRRLGFRDGDFPQAEDVGRRTVTLPLFPAMADEDVDRVCSALFEDMKNK